nr:4Fe-4S dicluster domain-containing protein [Phycisphaerales bacterium]
VHALAAAINAQLGAVGKTVSYVAASGDAASNGHTAMDGLIKAMNAGSISTIVTIETNPCFNAPGFEDAFKKVATRIVHSLEHSETSHHATWRLNTATYLEQWGDVTADDGTVSAIQPLIAPLYGGKSEVELLAIIAGLKVTDGYELTRDTWRAAVKTGTDFEKTWRRALWDGVLAGTGSAGVPASAAINATRVGEMLVAAGAMTGAGAMEISFITDAMGDGRWANTSWLQELPDPVGRVVWDNPAFITPATAQKLGVKFQDYTAKKPDNQVLSVKVGDKTLKIVAWVVPGVADDTLVMGLGNGRRATGLVGSGVGFDTFSIKPAMGFAAKADVTVSSERYQVSSTQLHGSMEGRAIIREVDAVAWKKFGDEPIAATKDAYGREMKLSLGERLEGSEMTHMPAIVSAYPNPYNGGKFDVEKEAKGFHNPKYAAEATRAKPAFAESPQWGMSIDLSACIGCNVCTIACQAENNIPVVGKIEVNKGREMHWIRVDRYFTAQAGVDENTDPSGMVYQPVACVHCENAPCEVVCPVNATVHGPEGHNYMVYNRCIGTRYCANNCPYKVRRFNFFDYGVTKFNGGLEESISEVTPALLEDNLPANQNLIPPRLRKKLDEISKLQKNPNVTVRSRGVMEKCTYCIQRTNEAKIELKIKGLRKNDEGVPDLFVQTACQQACPTGAITFGDILDTKSHDGKGSVVRQMREHTRSYALLGYLGVRPRTTYMVRVNNPNPKIRQGNDNPFGSHGGGAPHGGGGHGAAKGEGHTFIDRSKLHAEDGYKLSLGVLNGATGGLA